MDHHSQQKQGFIAASGAFAIWGIVVIFWKHLSGFNSLELIAHRLIWSPVILIAVVAVRGNLPTLIQSVKDVRLLKLHFINGLLLFVNWLAYVYAITHGQILQGSLAYFMVPILNTCMGFLILKEKLNKLQWAAITLATIGVANEIIQFGQIPWLALVIAVSFAFYGMNKTRSTLGPMTALAIETGTLLPVSIGIIVFFQLFSISTVHIAEPAHLIWMVSTGLVTITPLILFAYGAKRIQLATIGIFQFIAPSVKFFLGVFIYDEAFPPSKLITFGFIWVALIVYLIHLLSSKKDNGTV